VKLASNWVAFGGARYDLSVSKFSGTNIGLGYIDDCLILALNYLTGYSYSSATTTSPYTVVSNQQIMLQLSLRTLGNTTSTQTVGTSGASTSSGFLH
jgi:LPS-assembly protein